MPLDMLAQSAYSLLKDGFEDFLSYQDKTGNSFTDPRLNILKGKFDELVQKIDQNKFTAQDLDDFKGSCEHFKKLTGGERFFAVVQNFHFVLSSSLSGKKLDKISPGEKNIPMLGQKLVVVANEVYEKRHQMLASVNGNLEGYIQLVNKFLTQKHGTTVDKLLENSGAEAILLQSNLFRGYKDKRDKDQGKIPYKEKWDQMKMLHAFKIKEEAPKAAAKPEHKEQEAPKAAAKPEHKEKEAPKHPKKR